MSGWEQIAGPLLKVGSTALGTLIGGPLGATLGASVGPMLAQALGCDETPEAVAAGIDAQPGVVAQVEKDKADDIRTAIEAAQTEQLRIVNDTYRLELATESGFIRFARPACIWALMFVWLLHGVILGYLLLLRQFEAIRVLDSLTVFYGVMGAVAGVATWGRTKEKLAGVAGASLPDALATVAKAGLDAVRKNKK